ncbi:hypothetical protein C8Q80DRAFT_1101882 [Daedaleopsis nitida]|nr:hypothetical protein C8Q80DRAFT_1101882 [Daedaleopsis nitida]
MLSKINTSVHPPDRPTRRPHGPRSACSPATSSAKSASRTHYHDIWKARAGPSRIRTSPPQLSLPYDADAEQDPLFNISPDQCYAHAPRRYCLKLVDIDPLSSDEDSPFDSPFSFTASPVESPSYASTTFSPCQLSAAARPAPLSLHSHSLSQMSFFSPMSPEFDIVMRPFDLGRGRGDSVDRWIQGSGREPLMTPMVVDAKSHEHRDWDQGGQSDWREIVDRFLQHAEGDADMDDAPFPPTPGGNAW